MNSPIKNFRRSRSSSPSTYRSSKSKYRSKSRERSKYKRSSSRDRKQYSRDKNRSRRSRSKSYIKEYTSRPRKPSNSSDSSSSSNSSYKKNKPQKKPSVEFPKTSTNTKDNNTDCVIIDTKVIDEINEDKFAPKKFTSANKSKKEDKIVIDLQKQTIKVPEVEAVEPDSIFHHNVSFLVVSSISV